MILRISVAVVIYCMDVAQKAIDLDFDGLMIESHIDPDNAWSDAKQQVTPEKLAEMLDAIIWRYEDVNAEEYHAAHWKNCVSRSIIWMMN